MTAISTSTHSASYYDAINFLPSGLFLCLAAAYVSNGRFFRAFRGELIGSIIMVSLTYTLCKWFGTTMSMSWKAHSVGSALADIAGGGDYQVNPAMTIALLSLGNIRGGYTEAFVRIAGQVAGGLLSFPLCTFIVELMGHKPYERTQFDLETESAVGSASAEFVGSFIYCLVLLIVSYELHYGKIFNFIINKAGKSIARKVIFFFFSAAGPAMNPMLATAWDSFDVHQSFRYRHEAVHFMVYWVAPILGGALSALVYSAYKGGRWFGEPVSVGLNEKPLYLDPVVKGDANGKAGKDL